jgi:peptidyl-prolyl cis-trans isomerase C
MKSKYLPLIFLLIFIFACGKEKSSDNRNLLLARVGKAEITRKDFDASFIMDPQYAVRTSLRQARRSQLDFLIAEKYACLAATEINLDLDPDLQKKTSYIKKQEILKACLQQKFLERIVVSDIDLQEGRRRAGKKIFVQNIFCADLAAAQKIKHEITTAKDTNQIFNERGVTLGWISFGNLDQAVEDTIYSLTAGEISDPVKSNYGYHILKIDSVRMNYDFLMINPALQIQQVTEIIRNRKVNSEIQKYLSELAENKQIQIANRSLDLLTKTINTITPAGDPNPLTLVPPLQNKDLIDIRLKVSDMLTEPLLKFGDEQMTIGDFLERLKEMPPYHRPYLQGRNRIVQAMIDMVRNDLLLRQAETENFAGKREVRETYTKLSNEFLAREFTRRYNDITFRQSDPQEWQRYQQALLNVQREYTPAVFEQNLYRDVQNPDSILTNAPLPVFFKNRYIW